MCPETNNFSSIQEKNNNQASNLYSTWVRFVLRWQAKTRYIHARTNTFVMIVFREREVLCRRKKNIERRRDEERQNNRENEKKKNNHHFGHTRKFCTGLRSHVHVRRTVNEEKNTIYAYFVVRSLLRSFFSDTLARELVVRCHCSVICVHFGSNKKKKKWKK